MFFKSTSVTTGKGMLINADHIYTIEATTTGLKVKFENGETLIEADFNKLQNMLAAVVVPDGAYRD